MARHVPEDALKGMMTPAMALVLKSPEQGAATTVWAAIGKEWEGQGGKYLEDCSVSEPFADDPRFKDWGPIAPGYAPYIYDQDAAKQLWELSEKLTRWQD